MGISEIALSQGSASAWRTTEYIKWHCKLALLFGHVTTRRPVLWKADYSLWITAFSRFLRNVCFGNREDHCFSTPLYSTTSPPQQNLKYDPGRFNFRILLHVPCWEACAAYSPTCEALQGQNLGYKW